MFPSTGLFEDEDDEDDPIALREALAQRLLEYERYKRAAETLADRPMLGRDVFVRPPTEVLGTDRPVDPSVDAMGLLEIFYEVLQRSAAPPPSHSVTRETVSMDEVASWMMRRLSHGPRELKDLLGAMSSAGQRVMGFICTLEMAKLGIISVEQKEHLGPVILEAQRTPDDADLLLLIGGTR
jgi:segregation and condensation protein A